MLMAVDHLALVIDFGGHALEDGSGRETVVGRFGFLAAFFR
jgi:hypothetical protein